MRLAVQTNGDEVLRDFEAFLDDIKTTAFASAAATLRDQAQTAGLRKIAEVYKIGPRTMEKYVGVKLQQTPGGFEGTIFARGKGFPLYQFQPRQTKAGVTVSVKGRRFLIPHAFIARMRSGRIGVFARGAYGGKGLGKPTGQSFGRFAFGRLRLPINELFTLSPPDALANPEVTAAMADRVEEQAGKVIQAAIRFARRKG